MDLQPARNVGLENQLQAIQLGASLYDRAQTQKRMMEQLQVQTAESLLQRQGMELQNKIRDISLADTIEERQAQVDEFKTFSTLGKQVSDYLNNPKPDAVFPVVPAFKSKTYRAEADKMLNNLEKYSVRAELLKTQEKARTESVSKQIAVLKLAMQIPGAVDIDPQTEVPKINWTVYNAGRKQVFDVDVEQRQAKTTSLLTKLDIDKGKLNALIEKNASDADIAKARLDVQKSLGEARNKINEEELAFKKIDSTKRTDAYVQKLLQPVIQGDIKLQTYDDVIVRKIAADVSVKMNAFDEISSVSKILKDPYVDPYVKINTAKLLAKPLNSTRGPDAVSNQEVERILKELDVFSISHAFDTKDAGKIFGRDLDSFIKKIDIFTERLDREMNTSSERVNSIYRKYGKPIPAGTSQTIPSKAALITAPAPQAMGSTNAPAMLPTNAPAMSGTNSVSDISFKSTAEARAKGKKSGDLVIINGVEGKLN